MYTTKLFVLNLLKGGASIAAGHPDAFSTLVRKEDMQAFFNSNPNSLYRNLDGVPDDGNAHVHNIKCYTRLDEVVTNPDFPVPTAFADDAAIEFLILAVDAMLSETMVNGPGGFFSLIEAVGNREFDF